MPQKEKTGFIREIDNGWLVEFDELELYAPTKKEANKMLSILISKFKGKR